MSKYSDFPENNLLKLQPLVDGLDSQFTSHKFIFVFNDKFPEYQAWLKASVQPNPEQYIDTEFGKFLSKRSGYFNIEFVRTVSDMNIKGYSSPNALWEKI